jgi:hypothetical protein
MKKIVVSKNPMVLIDRSKEIHAMKGIGVPEYYLGGNIHQVDDPELVNKGIKTALSATTYITNTVEKFERIFGGPVKESKFPMIEGSYPESDTSMPLSADILGSLNWVVLLGRFDVMHATNTLARFSTAPCL